MAAFAMRWERKGPPTALTMSWSACGGAGMPATPSGRHGRCRGKVTGDANEKSSLRMGRSGNDDGVDAEERGWPRRRADADDNVYGR